VFTCEDARWVSETVGTLYAAQSVADLAGSAMAALDHKLRLHSFALEELGTGEDSFYRLHKLRCGSRPPENHVAYLHDNPFIWVLGAKVIPPVLHMRGDVRLSRWSQTDHFNGIARPMGWNDQIMIVARARPSFVSVGVHRDTIFSQREYELVRLLQPHMAAAWTRVNTDEDVLTGNGSLHIELSPELRPLNFTPAQRHVLRAYFPRWREGNELPSELQNWVRHSLEKLQRQPPPHPLYAFTIESARGRLLLRCFPRGKNVDLRMVETPATPNFLSLRVCGLTSRECEMLHWIAQGKRDTEIAMIVAIAPKTVGKHVENLLRKLGVETRGAAVSAARERLGA
jgi:DNA-binding CsgD family transcriptional regulator